MSYVYLKLSDGIFKVFHPAISSGDDLNCESTHTNAEAAARRVSFLNGGQPDADSSTCLLTEADLAGALMEYASGGLTISEFIHQYALDAVEPNTRWHDKLLPY